MSSRLIFQADSEAPAAGPMRSLFLALTQAALASTLSAGCDSETSEPERTDGGTGDSSVREPTDAQVDAQTQRVDAGSDAGLEPGTTAITCSGGMPDLIPALKTTRPVEYLGVFRGYWVEGIPSLDAGVSEPRLTSELAHQGQACSGVANPAECQAPLASLKVAPSCSTTTCPAFVVVQEAGALSRSTTQAELLALMGVIDSPAEAVLLAVVDGQTLCTTWSNGVEMGATIRAVASGYAIHTVYELCSDGKYRDDLTVDADGKLIVVEHVMYGPTQCVIGRRPDGLHEPSRVRCEIRLGAYLAESAVLEAASVFAFEKLARELAALDAPRALIEAVYEALQDEVRHTRDVSALARAQGAEPSAPVVQETPLRSRLALALDNISEGCVRETFGALLATYQAQVAHDAQVRTVMRTIAEDETRHAALSWKPQAWLEPQLTQQELAQVHAHRTTALATLQAELAHGLPAADRSGLGLPDASVALGLLAQLERAMPHTPSADA